MRVVTFDGSAVRKQKKIGNDKILLVFYNRPAIVVTVAEWEAGKKNLYYDANARRCDVVRTL